MNSKKSRSSNEATVINFYKKFLPFGVSENDA